MNRIVQDLKMKIGAIKQNKTKQKPHSRGNPGNTKARKETGTTDSVLPTEIKKQKRESQAQKIQVKILIHQSKKMVKSKNY